MGLDSIEADIHKKNEEKVNSIISNAEKGAKEIINKAKEQLFEQKKARAVEILGIIKEYKSKEIAQANLNARRLVLDSKKEAIEKLYQKIEEKLLQISPDDKKEILGKLIDKAKGELPGAKYVFSNSNDKGVTSELCGKAGLKFDGIINCNGGIIVETTNDNFLIEVDSGTFKIPRSFCKKAK